MTRSLRVRPSMIRGSEIRVVGDKSISHRAFLVNALGKGEARIRGANPGADVASTRVALRALGVSIVERGDEFLLRGRAGRLRPASDRIDCGNSGTTMRLLAGILAAQPFSSTLDGDRSLRARPMKRIARPLRAMGARVEGPSNGDRPPLIVSGGTLEDFEYEAPIASAQLKSCLLLAAASAGSRLRYREPAPSRDHSERMLRAMGAKLDEQDGWLKLEARQELHCVDVEVPADPSAAALHAIPFLLAAEGSLHLPALLRNPTRSGFFDLLTEMGGALRWSSEVAVAGEQQATLEIDCRAALSGAVAVAERLPSLIDEAPALAAMALRLPAGEEMRLEGIAELRAKESDRVEAIVDLLAQVGAKAEVHGDTLRVPGGQSADAESLRPADDHRMAMLAVGLAVDIARRHAHEVLVHGVESIEISDPSFVHNLRRAGADIDD